METILEESKNCKNENERLKQRLEESKKTIEELESKLSDLIIYKTFYFTEM
jgi:predicted RNase H-like nuclease (RuvC/YqgF family)